MTLNDMNLMFSYLSIEIKKIDVKKVFNSIDLDRKGYINYI